MNAWAACIPTADCQMLAALRLFPGVEYSEIDGLTWLRGNHPGDELDRALAIIPGLQRFEVLASGHLKSPHSRIPQGALPPTTWRSLKEAFVPTLPPAALAGEARQKLSLTLVRSRAEQSTAALLTNLDAWTKFATEAPGIRLEPLTFAVAADQQTLILGQPLPSLPGIRLTNESGILTPCGHTWSPPVDSTVLRDLFNLRPSDVAVLATDGTHQVIRAEQFVRASRSAARVTTEGLTHA